MNGYKDCYYQFQNHTLTVGNTFLERTWSIQGTEIIPLSLLNKRSNEEWLIEKGNEPVFRLPFFALRGIELVEVSSKIDDDFGIAQKHLKVNLEIHDQSSSVKMTIRIYPNKSFIRQEFAVKCAKLEDDHDVVSTNQQLPTKSNILLDANNKQKAEIPNNYVDHFSINDLHCQWKSVMLRDQTDLHNNLMTKEYGLLYPNENRLMQGNILFLQKIRNKNGLFMIKESPTPYGQLQYPGYDINIRGQDVYITGSGIHQMDVSGDRYVNMYGTCVGLYNGDAYDALLALHDYNHALRRYIPERDFFVMSNTWGDRNKDGQINEGFILSELKSAATLGITHYQIDDGWQQGVTMNSVIPGGSWGDYYSQNIDFWAIDRTKFPREFDPIIEQATEYGIQIGLWFSPDSSNDFHHWEKDAEIILYFFHKYGMRHFKLDGINITSKAGEVNYLKMLQQVISVSKGQVHFNQDTTAEKRLGFFGNVQYGSLFIENRYTDFGNYYPHLTLRNIWKLSWYVPVQKLQMEFLNTERNQHRYDKNDIFSPINTGILYSFAITMITNPLAWMEVSSLSEANQTVLKEVIHIYLTIQKKLLSGRVLPIGEEPTGISWTGFQSILNENEGFLLIFRENNTSNQHSLSLWTHDKQTIALESIMEMSGRDQLEQIKSKKVITKEMDEAGEFKFTLNKPNTFILYKYMLR